MHDAALRAHQTGILGKPAYQVALEFQRGPRLAIGDGREDRAAERGIEQGRVEAAVHGADRVIVAEFRQLLEGGSAFADLDE